MMDMEIPKITSKNNTQRDCRKANLISEELKSNIKEYLIYPK